jgi:hypothetical protein
MTRVPNIPADQSANLLSATSAAGDHDFKTADMKLKAFRSEKNRIAEAQIKSRKLIVRLRR